MYLIDNTYFKNKYQIDGILESQSGVSTKLTAYIDNFVVEFLQKLLGAVDFEDLNSNITDGVLDSGAPQKWLDFVNGASYTDNGKTYVWRGLLYLNGSVKRSLLTNYVYCQIIADLETKNGTAVMETKNVVKSVMRSQFVNVWNELAEQFDVCNNIIGNVSYIDGVPFYDYYGGSEGNGYVTMAKFLIDNKANYENVNLFIREYQNRFDLG